MSVVSNASPIIILSKIGLFHVLKDLFGEVHITEAVYNEVLSDFGRVGSKEVSAARDAWIRVHTTPSRSQLAQYRTPSRISHADASVLSLAVAQSATLTLIDDRTLRAAARQRGLTIAGTGEVLVRAKAAGFIQSVRDPLFEAVAKGARISKEVKNRLLERADELGDNEE